MNFQLFNCTCGVKVEGLDYEFPHVNSVVGTDPTFTKLTRGANGNNEEGLVYVEGIREPNEWAVTIMGLDQDLYNVLFDVWKNKTRCEPYCIDDKDGSSKMLKSAVLAQRPQQLTLDDTPDSLNVVLTFTSFAPKEKHKS